MIKMNRSHIFKKIILSTLFISFFILSGNSLFSQEIYWDFPVNISTDQAFYPQVESSDDFVMVMWQKFEEKGERISLYASFSKDGLNWSAPGPVIKNIDYFYEREVSIFSTKINKAGEVVVAIVTGEFEISIYKSTPGGGKFSRSGVIQTGEMALIAPRLYVRENGSLIVLISQRVDRASGRTSLSIFSSESTDGELWNSPRHIIASSELEYNFSPEFYTYKGREYIVFQSRILKNKLSSYQIYLKSRPSKGVGSWSGEKMLTTFEERIGDDLLEAHQIDNQRPFLMGSGDKLYLSWERAQPGSAAQIYLAEVTTGQRLDSVKNISRNQRINFYSRMFSKDNQLYISWFTDQEVVLGRFDGNRVKTKEIKSGKDTFLYNKPILFRGEIYMIWEKRLQSQSTVMLLGPDREVSAPLALPINFRRGQKTTRNLATIQWGEPEDPSGIEGYSYLWDRKPYSIPVKEVNYTIPVNKRIEFKVEGDGDWYFHLLARDKAGNWSNTVHLKFSRDITPPNPVEFFIPRTDELGYLSSNTFTVTWDRPRDDDVSGYSYKLQFLGDSLDTIDIGELQIQPPPETPMTNLEEVFYENRDNGVWTVVVSAFDSMGNMSRPSNLLIMLRRYIPFTAINTVVVDPRNEMERISLKIFGKGFANGGLVDQVILDKDMKEPYDYLYTPDNTSFVVTNDRVIEVPQIDYMREGIYYVGVRHPLRGIVFAQGQVKMDSTGTVKFGDFSYEFEELWRRLDNNLFVLSLNKVLVISIMSFLFLVMGFSIWLLVKSWREAKDLKLNTMALIRGDIMSIDMKKERLREMEGKGMGLRMQFILAFLTLVVIVALMVSISFGWFMVSQINNTKGEELIDQTHILMENIVASAIQPLAENDESRLSIIPEQIASIDEAVSLTITGFIDTDLEKNNYILGSNDPDINYKQEIPETLGFQFDEFMDLVKSLPDRGEEKALLVDSSYVIDNFKRVLRSDLSEEDRLALGRIFFEAGEFGDFKEVDTRLSDPILIKLKEIEPVINEQANELLSEKDKTVTDLAQRIEILTTLGDIGSNTERRELAEQIRLINEDIQNTLDRIETQYFKTIPGEDVEDIPVDATTDQQKEDERARNREAIRSRLLQYSYPPMNLDTYLSNDTNLYTFYRPVIFHKAGSPYFVRGAIRLTITVEFIKKDIRRLQTMIIFFTVAAIVIAIIIGILGAILLAARMVKPITQLVHGIEIIRDTPNKEDLKGHEIHLRSKDELASLAETINEMTDGLVHAAEANKDLIVGKEIQKMFIPLEVAKSGDRKLSTGYLDTSGATFFGYYEGAKGVSGDYFDFRKLDEKHYGVIKCDISGKGIPASLIMVEVATIFISSFKSLNLKRDGIHTEKVVYAINDLLAEIGFKGRFAALIIGVINIETGDCFLCNAGDNIVHSYNDQQKKMVARTINEVPAAGVFTSDMINMKTGYVQEKHKLEIGDILFLFTDGVEEAQRKFRTDKHELMICDNSCVDHDDPDYEKHRTHANSSGFEEFGIPRIQEVVAATLHRKSYILHKFHTEGPEKYLNFDFTEGKGTVEESVMAMIAVEKMFRIFPDEGAGPNDRIMIDNKVDEFLKKHFKEYREYFKYPVPNEEYPEYTYYTHLREDDQFDDLTVLAIRKK